MRLSTIKLRGAEIVGIVSPGGIVPMAAVNAHKGTNWQTDMLSLIEAGELKAVTDWYNAGGKGELGAMAGLVPFADVVYAPLYRNPKRMLGVGLNYKSHAGDLNANIPEPFPGTFTKPASCIVGPGDHIKIPDLPGAEKTTAEGELGVIMGKACKDVDAANWLDYVAGFTTLLDMTEEHILKKNPRFLNMTKAFDTFFSFGPELVTPDEINDVLALEVQTVKNGEVIAKNVVSNMAYTPAHVVALFSRVMGWLPGDVLSTGTPQAVQIEDGDVAECRIFGPGGFEARPLKNPVVDLRLKK